jgi:organic hydroperoxide reductase OsmC/OhrA
VLIICRIDVTYSLKIAEEHQDTAERIHDFHAQFCPVARSIEGYIEVSTALQMEPL